MSDRELLEMAAKAAGIELEEARPEFGDSCFSTTLARPWNPLKDDGDALRLAVALLMDLNINDEACDAFHSEGCVSEVGGENTAQVVRLAIVRAAADVGKAM